MPDSFHIATTVYVPPDLSEDTAVKAGKFYINRVLNSLGISNHRKPEVSHHGYRLEDNRGHVELYFAVPRDGLAVESVEQTLRDNANFFAQGIVESTGELYTHGIRGSQKYKTVVV